MTTAISQQNRIRSPKIIFWIMTVKGPSMWNPRAKYMTLHQPSTRAKDMGTTSPSVLESRITMVTSTMQA